MYTTEPTDMFTLLNIFALLWLALFNQCEMVHLPPPTNVSLSWVTDFCYKLSWSPPVENQTCIYQVNDSRMPGTLKYGYEVMEGGLLKFNLSALCGPAGEEEWSESVFPSAAFPELVRDFKCLLHSRNSLNCTWRPAKHVVDLRLYYHLVETFGPQLKENCGTTFELTECPAYQSDGGGGGGGGGGSGCALRGDFINNYVKFLFNGTVNGTLSTNTFQKTPTDCMQPRAVVWTGEEDNARLTIKWTAVDLPPYGWEYILEYTECGSSELKTQTLDHNSEPTELGHCAFNVTVRARHRETGNESLPGPHRVYGQNTNPHIPVILACTLIPAAVVVMAVVAMVCFRRHKKSIFPQVPTPQDFLPDMLKNDNGKVHKAMYVPAPEEEPENVRFDIRA